MDDADIKDARVSQSASVIPDKPVNSTPYLDFRTINAMMAMVAEMEIGTVTGTGADLIVSGLEFDPAFVILINITDPTLGLHVAGMTADHMVKLTDAPALTIPTSNGITLGAKGERRFLVGADADLNVSAEVIRWIAFGGRGVKGSL